MRGIILTMADAVMREGAVAVRSLLQQKANVNAAQMVRSSTAKILKAALR